MKQVPAVSSLFLQLLKASLWILHEPSPLPWCNWGFVVQPGVICGAGSPALTDCSEGEGVQCPGARAAQVELPSPAPQETPVICGDSDRDFPCSGNEMKEELGLGC